MKLDLSSVPNLKPNPIFKDLPESLKDPENFKSVEGQLQRILISDHKHRTVTAYVKCKQCQVKFNKRKVLMKHLGFKDIAQYIEWKKIMTIITQQRNFQLQ